MTFYDCYRLSLTEIEQKIKAEIKMPEFLFARTICDEYQTEVWDMYCSACGSNFLEEKKQPLKNYSKCPMCGADIHPKRWNGRREITKQRFTYQHFARGQGSSIWLHSFDVRRDEEGELILKEYSRCFFDFGTAKRWNIGYKIKEIKDIKLKLLYTAYGTVYENYIGTIDQETIKGSCIEYSQIDRATKELKDPIEYLSLYIKNPFLEFVFKMDLSHIFLLREKNKSFFSKVVNMRAKNFKNLFFGLNQKDIPYLQNTNTLEIMYIYRILRMKYKFAEHENTLEYAKALYFQSQDNHIFLNKNAKKIYDYLQKQAKKTNISIRSIVSDYKDYLNQLKDLDIKDGDLFPKDLISAHERLMERANSIRKAKKNAEFRIKRKLLKQYYFRADGLFIRPINSENELIKEGETLRHCVASYSKRHLDTSRCILVIRRTNNSQNPFYTVEMDTKTNKIVQCRGFKNKEQTLEVAEFMQLYKNYLKECI